MITKKTKKKNISKRYSRKTNKWKKIPKTIKLQRKNVPTMCLNSNLQSFEKTIKNDTESERKKYKKEIINALKPSKILPQNDFYSYINDKWLKEYKIPEEHKYIIQQDDFRIVQDKVYRQLMDLIQEYIKSPKSNTPFGKCLKTFFNSQLRNCSHEQSKTSVDNFLSELDNSKTVWDFIGYINKNEIISWGCPFVWSLNPDDKEPDKYRCFIDSPQPTLIDINLYFNDTFISKKEKQYAKKYKHKYLSYLHELFKNVFGRNYKTLGYNVKDVFDVELDILLATGCNKVKVETNDANYYRIYKTDITKDDTYKPFDWNAFSKAIGFKNAPSFFITSNPHYIKCGAELLLNNWKSQKWRTYWTYIFIRQQQRWSDKGHTIYYNFHGKYVRGQGQEIMEPIKPIYGMGFAFNTFLTYQYIKKYENPFNIAYIKNMAEDLKQVFIRIIENNKWLQPETKKYALKKLHYFNLTVASPLELRSDPILDYEDNNPWENLCKLAYWRAKKFVELEDKKTIDMPLIDWSQIPPKFISTQAYVVNASYTPSKNGIYIPLGYIQPPFVDLQERGIEYNLAHIGFTLAHEMSHALDDWGSQYDHLGKLSNWWKDKDRAYFKRIQNDVIKQYETFAKYDGIKFDASISIGEDLADISGLAICQEYLRDFQNKNDDILPIKTLSMEAFFVYFAYQQRQKLSKKALEAQLKTNPHPLDKYRTNVPLSRLELFRIFYNIKRGDKMWWHSTNCVWS